MIRALILAKPILHFSVFSTKNSSSNPSRYFLFQISNFSTFPHNTGSSNPATTSYPSRRHEEESRNVRVSVWWDFENCNLPTGANVFRVAQNITAAVRASGIKGPIRITAFGDIMQMSRTNQEALSSTGIILNHIPRGGKNSADRSLLVDLMYWVSQNPPPAHLFLISGDRDFAGTLHRLRMNNYNVLLASTDNAPSVLCSAASIMWQWNSLVKGEGLSGKHFNQPPDGPYGSWYGHYKAPLEDPFAVVEQSVCLRASSGEPSTCPQSEDLPDSALENKVQSIPKVVVNQIRMILSGYPNGISITELRAELSKSNLTIDRDFYGHKKFSKFLLAMPHILKLQSRNDGQFFVRSVTPKHPEQGSSVSKGPLGNGEVDSTVAANLNDERGSSSGQLDAKSSTSSINLQDPSITVQKPTGIHPELPLPEPKAKIPSTNVLVTGTDAKELFTEAKEPPVQDGENGNITASQLHIIEQGPVSEVGFFRNIWRKWRKDGAREEKFSNANKVISSESKAEGKDVTSLTESVKSVGIDSSLHNSDEVIHIPDDGTSRISLPSNVDTKTQGSGSFRQFLRKLFRGAHPNESGEFSGKMNQAEIVSEKNEKFGEKRFWDELKAFLDTSEGSAIVKQSRTRKQMGQDLQKQGPPILLSLSEADLLHLVELIILEKKWIKESPTKSYPFKLVLSGDKGSSSRLSNISCQSNDLSTIFSSTHRTSLSQRLREIDGQKRHALDAEESEPAIGQAPSCKYRSEVLADCQKLLDAIVKKHPEGFNMGNFRKEFSERYNYSLDIRKLGYQKLVTLLQIMPGVRIESNYILPAGNLYKTIVDSEGPSVQEIDGDGAEAHSENYLTDGFGKEDDTDSPWEELGPLDNSSSKKNGKGPATNRSSKDEMDAKLDHDYESLSEDYFTDSEEETSSSTKPETQNKMRINEEDSSLLQILDSWYSTKDDSRKKGTSENLDQDADSSINTGSRVLRSAQSSASTSSETPAMNCARKARPFKKYSFVQDNALENNDRLIDGILGSLKKPGERETRI